MNIPLTDRFRLNLLLGLISLIYFCLFIPINLSGSDELSKIRIFSSLDEYAQIVALEQMINTTGKGWKQIIGDFLLHNHAYGYPFYFFSSLLAIPIKLLQLSRPEELQWMMFAFRQQVVIFNIASCLLMVHLWTGFRKPFPSIFLFVFLLSIPALSKHNLIWHPDALSTLFIILTLYGLVRDQYRLGKWFYVSAVACGLACSTKFMGPFLFLLILTYLILAWKKTGVSIKMLISKASLYGLVTATTFIVSSPLIVFGYYKNIVAFLTDQSKMNNFGWGVEMPKGIYPWYSTIIESHFFHWWTVIPLLLLSGFVIYKREKNWELNLLILAAIVPLFVYVVSVIGHKNYFYLYPVFFLFASTVPNAFSLNTSRSTPFARWMFYGFATLLITTTAYNIVQSFRFYQKKAVAISSFPGYSFYRKIQQKNFLQSRQADSLTVLHTPFIYLPDTLSLRREVPYGLISEDIIRQRSPDLIIFEKKDAYILSDTSYQNRHSNPSAAKEANRFFQASLNNRLPGYSLGLIDNYGVVLVKNQK